MPSKRPDLLVARSSKGRAALFLMASLQALNKQASIHYLSSSKITSRRPQAIEESKDGDG
jgi:hypothetical protein